MTRFIEPLLEVAGPDERNIDRAMTLGMALWNLAICKGSRREQLLAALLEKMPEEDQEGFRQLASDMIERHREMFLAMHKTP